MKIDTEIRPEGVSQYLVAFDEAVSRAVESGFVVEVGDSRTLLLDLDTEADRAHFGAIFPRLVTFLKCRVTDRWPSKSGRGEHVKISSPLDLSVLERLLIQACLGSDREHELLSLVTGVWEGNSAPTVLFRPAKKGVASQ